MGISLVPQKTVYASEDKNSNMEGFSATLIADPDTSQSETIFNGSPSEDGKIWTDKSVTTGTIYGAAAGEDNFNIALSAMGQTYSTVTTSMEATEELVAYDVVFVLDFSGSMTDGISSSWGSNSKAQAMVDAVNPAITTLMENENNRIGIVAYSGSSGSTSNATELFSLDHYTTSSDGEYLQYSSSSIRSARRSNNSGYYVQNSQGNNVTSSKSVTGGTPTQAGIYKGMDMLDKASKSEDVARIPILVLLTDGAAGYAYDGYQNLNGSSYTGTAGNGRPAKDAEVGAYTMLTANYAKDKLNQEYKEIYGDRYSEIFSDYTDETAISKFYTIGLGITNSEWTHFTLEPSTTDADRDSTVTSIKQILARDSTYGSNYNYADKYFGGSITEEQLKQIFADILADMEVEPQVTTSVNNPVSESGGGAAAGSKITFSDYLGYKMELKGEKQYLRYRGVNYVFEKQTDGSYRFNGTNQDGDSVTGPVVTEDGKSYDLYDVDFQAEFDSDLTVNGQKGYWKVTWSFPSALLPMYSRANDYNDSNLEPIRMLYEVGLEETADLSSDGLKIDEAGNLLDKDAAEFHDYAFYTNLYDFKNKQAKTTVEFNPSLENPYYYKTGYTSEVIEGSAKYLKVDMEASKTQTVTVNGTADVTLTNLSANNSRVSFSYDGRTYSADLTGSSGSYQGSTTILVTGKADNGSEMIANAVISFDVSRHRNWGSGSYSYEIDSVTVNGKTASLSNTTATANNVPITTKQTVENTGQEIISVYMELKTDDDGQLYVEDLNGKRINVEAQSDGTYEIVVGKNTYYSNVYYKYTEGTQQYQEKELDKGTMTKSYVGSFEVVQPENENELTEANFKDYFVYHSADGAEHSATGILFSDGSTWGTVTESGEANRPAEGTFKVLVDGITNEAEEGIEVNFEFIVETQRTDSGIKYGVLESSYWEAAGQNQKSVDMHLSTTPEVKEDGSYWYDVSYTIVIDNPDDTKNENNKTHTDSGYFTSELTAGALDAYLGNNGRVAVQIADNTYGKSITVNKTWLDGNGNVIPNDNAGLSSAKIEVGLYQTYSYVDQNGDTITSQEGSGAFTTVELNQGNLFSHTWGETSLPRYLTDSGGNIVLDYTELNNPVPVEVNYTVKEISGTSGWVLDGTVERTETDTVVTFALTNVPNATFSPSVTKEWTKDGEPADAPEDYKLKVELLANGQVVKDSAQVDAQNQVVATLTQADESSDAVLQVQYGGNDLGTQDVPLTDFAGSKSKEYTFTYGSVGTPGSGSYADKVEVRITVSDTYGGKLGISDAKTVYSIAKADGSGQFEEHILPAAKAERTETDDSKTVTFTMKYLSEKEASVILDGTETEPWSYTWENDEWHLPLLTQDPDTGNYEPIVYTVKETLLVPDASASGGYKEYPVDEDTGLIQVSDTEVYKVSTESTADYQFTITNDLGVTERTAEKVWIDNNNAYTTRPDQITFTLQADGTAVSGGERVITPDGTPEIWNGTTQALWENLPVYNPDTGEKIAYTVEETMGTLPGDSYKTTVQADPDDDKNFIVTNQLSTDTTVDVSVDKTWVDDNDAAQKRPDNLYMVLYSQADGGQQSPAAKSPLTFTDDVLSGNWTDLPKYNGQGQKINYSVKEFSQLGDDPVEWADGYTYTVDSDTDTAGNIAYSFTNTLADGEISKTVTKVWKDAALADQRPDTVTVELSAVTTDGAKVDLADLGITAEQILSDGTWTYTWDDLPEYQNGMKVDYTVTETMVGDQPVTDGKAGLYQSVVTDDGAGNDFTVTNTLTDSTTVSVTKDWVDNPDSYTIEDVNFDVYGENPSTAVDHLIIPASAPESTVTSGALPKYNAEGEVITYTVKEDPISETETYKIVSEISDNQGTGGTFTYTATNTYVTLIQDLTGTKTWEKVTGNNIPSDITIELHRKAGDQDETVTTDLYGQNLELEWNKTGSIWNYTFKDLPIYDQNDEKYEYYVVETKIGQNAVADTDYKVTYDNSGLHITNTLEGTVDGADLAGTKTWADVEESNIPDSISVALYRSVNGGTLEPAEDTAQKEVKISVNKEEQADAALWSFDFDGVTLPKYDSDGNEYVYTVKEVSITSGQETASVVYQDAVTGTVGDYTVALSGMDITNTLKAEGDRDQTTEFPVEKIWDVPAGTTLPDDITVQLYQNDTAYGTEYTFTADDIQDWKHTFTNLRKYEDDGITPYTYSVEETKVGAADVVKGKAGDYAVTVSGGTITNKFTENAEDITITKTWKDVEVNNLPDSIQVQLYQDGIEYGDPVDITKAENTSDADANVWTYTFEDLPVYSPDVDKYQYTVKELSVTAGSTTADAAYSDTDSSVGTVGDYNVKLDGLTITNTLKQEDDKALINYPVTKNWADVTLANIPESITIQLMQDNKDAGSEVVLTADNGVNDTQWAYTYENLRKYADNGITPYTYTAKETKIGSAKVEGGRTGDFFTTYTQQDKDATVIENRYASDTEKAATSFTVTKKWTDAKGSELTEDLPDSITVQLKQDNAVYAEYTFTKEDIQDNWSHTFKDLPEYQEDGVTKYHYSVEETKITQNGVSVNVENGKAGSYEVSVNDAGNEITNKLTDDTAVLTTAATITKTWEGVAGSNIPEIQVQLVQDGKPLADKIVKLTADTEGVEVKGNTWTYTFKDLEKYTAGGIIEHVYTVQENSVDGKAVDQTTQTAGDYKVSENGLAITNTLTGTVDISGEKIWKDAAKDEERPDEITVELYREAAGESEYVTKQKVGTSTDWSFTFADQSKYDKDGNLYQYSVKEKGESSNQITYNGNTYKVAYSENGYNITNTLTGEYHPDVNPIKVTKHWMDDENSQNQRPETLKVSLTQNGTVVEGLTLTKADAQKPADNAAKDQEAEDQEDVQSTAGENSNDWMKAFADTYPMYDEEGNLYQYAVTEDKIENYTLKSTEGSVETGFVLTNVYDPGNTTITVQKAWNDNQDAEGLRPESITVTLLQNGNVYKEQEITGSLWQAKFDVPAADENGKIYTYTVDEKDVTLEGSDSYRKSIDGFTITNTLEGKTDVSGTKEWKNISPENRPESVTVELWRSLPGSDAVKMEGDAYTKVLSAENDWKYDFGTLDKYDESGKMYTYTIKETLIGETPIEETDYEAVLDGYNLINSLKEETKTAVTISGTKTWVDNDNQYGMRPESITVNLLCGTEIAATAEVTADQDGNWTYEFKDLPKYNMETGELLTYTIEEVSVENYETILNGYDLTNKLDESKIPQPEEPETPVEPEEPETPAEPEEPEQTTTVKTGDEANAAGFTAAAVIALGAAVVTIALRRRKTR